MKSLYDEMAKRETKEAFSEYLQSVREEVRKDTLEKLEEI